MPSATGRRTLSARGWLLAAVVFAALLFPMGAHAPDEAVLPEARVPGMDAQRIEEPVFGGQMVVYEAGRGNARGILLVPGIGPEGARDFRDHIAWLQKSFHVVAVDLPGFGQSDKANVLYSPSNYAAVLKHVAGRFLNRPFVLLGHSMGAVVSLRYAAMYPEDVERLVLVDVAGVLHRYTLTSQYLAHLGAEFVPPVFDSFEGLAGLARKLLAPLERLPIDPQVVLASPQLRASLLSADPARIAGLAVASEDLRQTLPRIAAETLVVWGAQDTITPLRTGRVLVKKLPRARLTVIERAGHEVMIEAPARFRDAIEPFLERGLQPAPAPASVVLPKHGQVSCLRKRDLLFEGEYDRLTLDGCQQIRIRNARVRELVVLGSSVAIDDSHLGGGARGLYALDATIEITGGRIEGDVAIEAIRSRLDLAAVEVEGREAVVRAPERSYVVLSLCRVKSPRTRGEVHEFFTVTAKNPL
jgi:pimeloyl-ACP methyl ester carboxylesterase